MKRQVYRLKAGSLSNLKIETEELAAPESQEVTIAVKAIGLNFADVFAIWGLYGATPEGRFIPGLEYAGTVIAKGAEVSQYQVGDRIMGVTRFGAYASHLNIDARYVRHLPATWSFQEGAAFLVQVLTAYYGLKRLGNIQKGQTILIHSAAGGVGILANRIAKKYDAYTIGTVGRSDKVAFLRAEGYDDVIVRDRQFRRKLTESLGDRELAIIMECIGGRIFKIGYDLLAQQGRMIVYGSARYASPGNRPNYLKLIYHYLTRPKIDPQKIIELNKSVMGFNLIWLYERAALMEEVLSEVMALNLEKPHVGHEFSFHDLPDAVRLFQTGKTIGKVVVNLEV